MGTYSIFEGNMERLEKKLQAISNKCKKYECDFSYRQTGTEFKEITNREGQKVVAKFITIEAEGKAIISGGYRFVASVDHTEKGNIIKGFSDIEVPQKYYDMNPICEHCNSNRYRKLTYIVMDENGTFKQVGKSCLKDFTSGMSAEAISLYISLFDELIEGQSISGSGYFSNYFDTKEVLKYACETIKIYGYVKKDPYNNNGTASKVYQFYGVDKGLIRESIYRDKIKAEMKRINFNAESKQNIETINSAIEWINRQEETNNYIHNLKTISSLEYVDLKNLGILVSLFQAYYKGIEREETLLNREIENKNDCQSEYIGEIGNRITINISSAKCLTSWETDFGITFLYKFISEGNVITWKTGKDIDCENVKSITGTIKAHTEYREVKQTELTRCKIA